MNHRERAKLLQDDGFLADLQERLQRKYYDMWMAEDNLDEQLRLWQLANVVQDAIKQINAMGNEYRHEQTKGRQNGNTTD